MDRIEVALAFVFGFGGGYALRSAISAARRRRFYRLRRENILRAAEAARVFASENSNKHDATIIPLSPAEAP
jgi:hypothetical protein